MRWAVSFFLRIQHLIHFPIPISINCNCQLSQIWKLRIFSYTKHASFTPIRIYLISSNCAHNKHHNFVKFLKRFLFLLMYRKSLNYVVVQIGINSGTHITAFYQSAHHFDFVKLDDILKVCSKFKLYFTDTTVEDNAARNERILYYTNLDKKHSRKYCSEDEMYKRIRFFVKQLFHFRLNSVCICFDVSMHIQRFKLTELATQ